MLRLLVLIPFFLAVGCKGGKIPAEDCQAICGSDSRLELILHECGRIHDLEDAETCRLTATDAFNTCHSRCE